MQRSSTSFWESFPTKPCLKANRSPVPVKNLKDKIGQYKARTNAFTISRKDNNGEMKRSQSINYFVRPQKGSIYRGMDFDENWAKFCRGKLGGASTLTCKGCGHLLCTQSQLRTHAYTWLSGVNQRSKGEISFLPGDISSVNQISRSYAKVTRPTDTEPRECNGVFLKNPEWMRFYYVDNGGNIGCPGCKKTVGQAKLSGIKCSCGHWSVPGYQLLRHQVKVNKI
jgi:hypothetical protein